MVSRFSFRFSLSLGQSSCISNVISKSYRIYQGYQNILKRNADGILDISDYPYIGSSRNHLKPDFTRVYISLVPFVTCLNIQN